jgi:hypothetical protein
MTNLRLTFSKQWQLLTWHLLSPKCADIIFNHVLFENLSKLMYDCRSFILDSIIVSK